MKTMYYEKDKKYEMKLLDKNPCILHIFYR